MSRNATDSVSHHATLTPMDDSALKYIERLTRKTRALTNQRDGWIREAKREGHTVTDIAKAAGLSRSQVHRILAAQFEVIK